MRTKVKTWRFQMQTKRTRLSGMYHVKFELFFERFARWGRQSDFNWFQLWLDSVFYLSHGILFKVSARGTLVAGFERWRRWRSCRGQIISDMAYEHLICTRCVCTNFVSFVVLWLCMLKQVSLWSGDEMWCSIIMRCLYDYWKILTIICDFVWWVFSSSFVSSNH
jgi:hypothetical protein